MTLDEANELRQAYADARGVELPLIEGPDDVRESVGDVALVSDQPRDCGLDRPVVVKVSGLHGVREGVAEVGRGLEPLKVLVKVHDGTVVVEVAS